MGEQVPQGATGLCSTDIVIEADDVLFDSDQHRPRDDRFCQRGHCEAVRSVADDDRGAGVVDEAGSAVGHRPGLDGSECVADRCAHALVLVFTVWQRWAAGAQGCTVLTSSAVRNANSRPWRPLSRGSQTVS